GAGSDLAALTTRADADGDGWVVTGHKVWTSFAHIARFGILLARSDPDAPRHRAISYFVCPMDAPGVSVHPLVDMTGEHAFNEVYLDEVRLPGDHLVGSPGQGWELAKVTLGNERVSLSGEGVLWGRGPTADDLLAEVRASGGAPDPVLRDRLVSVFCESEILKILRRRTLSAVLAGRAPGPEASVRKAISDRHGQRVMDLGRDLAGPWGTLGGTGVGRDAEGRPAGPATAWPASTWAEGFLYSPALTIGGGTAEVQRDIVAERVLGLPRGVQRPGGTNGPASA
ncbi:MAG TPA: acyl-CoA dehydrogenase family protein, partial [Acidimicrobiales bacterium]|nr:acyl-CoA dehydrogenase family protein [Acidimicrobiales bacterium]